MSLTGLSKILGSYLVIRKLSNYNKWHHILQKTGICDIKTTMSALANKLVRYYCKKKNRLIFSNGMNLSNLAISMWEQLGYREIDASVLSRVLDGERLFSFKQLKVFCEILKIPQHEVNSLVDSLYSELSFKFGFEEIFYVHEAKHLTNLVTDNLDKISLMKEKGYPTVAINWIDDISEKIQLGLTQSHDLVTRKVLNGLFAKLLIQKIFCIYESDKQPGSVERVFHIAHKLDEINTELKDPSIFAFSMFSKGGAYYVKKSYKLAIPYLQHSIALPLSDSIKIQAFRQLSICYAIVGDANKSEEINKILVKDWIKDSKDMTFQIFEGIARSYSEMLDEYNALSTLEKANEILGQIESQGKEYKELRKIQLTRTKLEVYKKNRHIKINTNYVEKISKEGMQLAINHGYSRHLDSIRKLSQQILS